MSAGTYADAILGGGLLIELALADAVTVAEKKGFWQTATVQARPGASVEDPVLAQALALVAEKERGAQDVVTRLGKGLKDTLTSRLVERGILQRREQKVFGLFPHTTWPSGDSTHEQAVRHEVEAALLQGVPTREVRARAKEISEGAWAAVAVRTPSPPPWRR